MAEYFPECADVKLTLINPVLEVLEDGSKETREEGCLSLPGIHEPVPRIEKIRLKWLDENFQPHEWFNTNTTIWKGRSLSIEFLPFASN